MSTLDAVLLELGRRARAAANVLGVAPSALRTSAIHAMAQQLRDNADRIAAANDADLAAARTKSMSEAFIDRLRLDRERVRALAESIANIATQPDPVGAIMADWTRPNGLRMQRVRVPIGVLGMIFESRPNVAADAGALAIRSGNAIILRGGSDSARSVAAIVASLREALRAHDLPTDAIQAAPTADRAAVGAMLAGLGGAIDVIIPRGGKELVARVQQEARTPVLAHLAGVCHVYVHASADPAKARQIALNAKMRRVSVCGATETLLIDRTVAPTLLPAIAQDLRDAGCALRGDDAARAITAMDPANEDDWRAEYLAPILAVRVVEGLGDAVAHIAQYGTGHTEAIVTEDETAAARFMREVDSAIVLHNASTQFADGGEFGFGGEIGIATGRLHARGPVGAEQLTTFKYLVHGSGQIRP